MRITTRSLIAVELCFLLGIAFASASIFDSDPQHPWERLHRQLYTRTLLDGSTYDQETLDSPMIPRSKYFLIEAPSHEQAISALDNFLNTNAEKQITDPLKRAIFQRDLWAVFTTLYDPRRQEQPARQALQQRLAQVMQRVALTPDQIAALPDNLAATTKAATFPKAYDPEHPDRYFLPPDLLDKDGPWVVVGNRLRPDGLNAPGHAEFTRGRSVFTILLKLPEGRKATTDYLTSLQQEVTQIPPGTQVALLRRTLLIDQTGTLQPTALTENLQIRVYPKLTPDGRLAPEGFEFTLQREDLIAGRNGGLHPIDAKETAYYSFLGAILQERGALFGVDPLETNPITPPTNILQSCIRCHPATGIWGFQSLFLDHFPSPPPIPSDAPTQTRNTLQATQKTEAWTLLQNLWEKQPSTGTSPATTPRQ